MKHDLTFLEELALLGLARGKNSDAGLTASGILTSEQKKAVTGHEPKLGPSLDHLAELGMIEKLPRKKGNKSSRWHILPTGSAATDELLGGFNATGKNWAQQTTRFIAVRRALGLDPRLVAALLKVRGGVGLPAYFLAQRLGEEYLPSATPDSLARRATAKALGLPNDQPSTLWQGLYGRAAATRTTNPETAPEPSASKDGSNGNLINESHLSFAEQVLRAARVSETGWFGSDKIFINHAWESWRTNFGSSDGLSRFKARLLEALQSNELTLSRADFLAGLDPEDLHAAAIQYGPETFHYIKVQREERK